MHGCQSGGGDCLAGMPDPSLGLVFLVGGFGFPCLQSVKGARTTTGMADRHVKRGWPLGPLGHSLRI